MSKKVLLWVVVMAACIGFTDRRSVASEPADLSAGAPLAGPIPPTFFGMHIHARSPHQPWPTVRFGSFRMLGILTSWAAVNKAEGVYDWNVVDAFLVALKEHGVDNVIYTFDKVPPWASSKPNDDCTARGRAGMALPGVKRFPGSCDPPNDLNPDGTGSNKHWKDYVTAVATHARNSSGARIRYWEVLNEPHNEFFWTGTFPQIVRMARDAYTIIKSIDPDALILSPSGTPKWLDGYFAAGGGAYTDVIAVHGYIHSGRYGDYPNPAKLIQAANELRNVLAKHGLSNKPIWDTEASWGSAPAMGFEQDEDFQAAFLAQFYLIHWSLNIPRFYWFAWNDGAVGRLWIPEPGNPNAPGRATKAAAAYAELYHWLVGSTMTKPCSQDGGFWTCGLTRPDGREAQVVWSSRDFKSYTPKASLKKMRDLDGQVEAVRGAIRVGPKPVLLESQ